MPENRELNILKPGDYKGLSTIVPKSRKEAVVPSPQLSPERLLQQLQADTRQTPAPDAVAVVVGAVACGWASPTIAATLVEQRLAQRDDRGLHLPDTPAALQAVARGLHQAGLLKGWRNEALDILAPDDAVLGRIERAAMRALGLRTRAVHLQALGSGQRIWIARRADHKSTDPGLWDTLVGGLVGAGEALDVALLRESNEEAGLTPADLVARQPIGQFVVSRHVPEGYQVESTWISACELPPGCRPRNLDGEVAAIELATIPEVLAGIAAGQFTVEAALSILHWLVGTRPNHPGGPATP